MTDPQLLLGRLESTAESLKEQSRKLFDKLDERARVDEEIRVAVHDIKSGQERILEAQTGQAARIAALETIAGEWKTLKTQGKALLWAAGFLYTGLVALIATLAPHLAKKLGLM